MWSLADEINRAPAQDPVGTAGGDAGAAGHYRSSHRTIELEDSRSVVIATQNPIEQEGTYPLPEAQLDRFMLYVRIGYPSDSAEHAILRLAREDAARAARHDPTLPPAIVTETEVHAARGEVLGLHLAPELERYLVELVLATREPARHGEDLARWIAYGASPRASIALDRGGRAHAWLAGRDYVSPEDVQAIAHDVLRHRVLLTYEAEAEGVDADTVVGEVLARVPVP